MQAYQTFFHLINSTWSSKATYRPIHLVNSTWPEEPIQHGRGNISWPIKHDLGQPINIIQHGYAYYILIILDNSTWPKEPIQHGWDDHFPGPFNMTQRDNSAWPGECLMMLPQRSIAYRIRFNKFLTFP